MITSGAKFFCAWSGGKDCCRALHEAMKAGAVPHALLTMCTVDGRHTLTHHLPVAMIEAQADALGLPLVTRRTTWARYADEFRAAVHGFANQGVAAGLTGDTEFGQEWLQRLCREHGLQAWLPLWEVAPAKAFREFLRLGFKAVIVAASDAKLGGQMCGRLLDAGMVAELEARHADILGEYNEYHTFVIDGPIFRHPVPVQLGARRLDRGYWLQDLTLGPER